MWGLIILGAAIAAVTSESSSTDDKETWCPRCEKTTKQKFVKRISSSSSTGYGDSQSHQADIYRCRKCGYKSEG